MEVRCRISWALPALRISLREVKIRLDGKHRLFRLSATIIRGDGEPIPTFSAVVDHDEITNVTAGPQQRLALPAHKIIGAAIARDNALGALETMRDEEHRVLVLEESEQRHRSRLPPGVDK